MKPVQLRLIKCLSTVGLYEGLVVQSAILICGNEKELLDLRGLVLEAAGYQVAALIGLEALKGYRPTFQVPLTVLCHSLAGEEQEEGIRSLLRRCLRARRWFFQPEGCPTSLKAP